MLFKDAVKEISFQFSEDAANNNEAFLNGDDMQGKTSFINGNSKKNRKVRVTLNATVIGEGISSSEYGQSVFCEFDDYETKVEPFMNELEMRVTDMLPKDIMFKEFCRENGEFFLKLGHKNGVYNAVITPDCNPDAIEKAPFKKGSKLVIECTINVFVNYETKIAGFFLGCSKIDVDQRKKLRR